MPTLAEKLAPILPKPHKFHIHHLSTPPFRTEPLCSPPPNEVPDRTFCENHFLAIAVDAPESLQANNTNNPGRDGAQELERRVLVLAFEVFVFTTAYASTFFVSKADSTGYLTLLGLGKGASPVREISTAFIEHLVETRRRADVQCIVSLFARAQHQYLFPGSVENEGKHVLDDTGLVKWWCKVLNPLLEHPPLGREGKPWKKVRGYLVIPGLDTYETKAFIPRTQTAPESWELAHPLEKISHYAREYDWVPARCLIPRFPDDPKSRFRDELDEEARNSSLVESSGLWKSVRTVDQFWEMMAFRQECSSGRMTGFIWVVFDQIDYQEKKDLAMVENGKEAMPQTPERSKGIVAFTPTSTPRKLFSPATTQASPLKGKDSQALKKKKQRLKGPIKAREPRIKTSRSAHLLKRPISTSYYFWPEEGRGESIVDEHDYKRAVELLLRLDFANLELAIGSTERWVMDLGMGKRWGYNVVGTKEAPAGPAVAAFGSGKVNNLSGLVKRKRTVSEDQSAGREGEGDKVNVLSAGMVRKKKKESYVPTDGRLEAVDDAMERNGDGEKGVNMLVAGLVRKKRKN